MLLGNGSWTSILLTPANSTFFLKVFSLRYFLETFLSAKWLDCSSNLMISIYPLIVLICCLSSLFSSNISQARFWQYFTSYFRSRISALMFLALMRSEYLLMMACDYCCSFLISECAIWMISYSWMVILALNSSSRLFMYPLRALKLWRMESSSSIFDDLSQAGDDLLRLLSRRCLNSPLRQRGRQASVRLMKESSGMVAISLCGQTLLLQFYYSPIKPPDSSIPHQCILFNKKLIRNDWLSFLQAFLLQLSTCNNLLIMSKFYTTIGHFLIGFTDSVSPRWIREVLFYTDRTTKKFLPESVQLQKALLRSLVQAGLITTLLPIIVRWLGFVILGWILTGLSLIFTYSYLIFYNMDVTQKAMKVIIWKTQQHPTTMPELDKRYKYNSFVEMSYLIQSFIFQMVYYTPMNLLLIIITLFDEKYFPVLLVIMDSFFNACFYYFRKWPYDNFNVAFLEKHMSYCLGYGFFVSVVTNVMLPPSMSIGGYLLISQWMIINALYHTPPHKEFSSFAEIYEVLVNRDERRKLPSAYNIHREKLKEREYRKKIMKDCVFMKSFFGLTERINLYLNQKILNRPVAPAMTESRYDPSAETETTSKITLPTEGESKITGQSVLQQNSDEFFDARSEEPVEQHEETMVLNLQFRSSSDGGEKQKEK